LGDSSEPVALRYARGATLRIIGTATRDRGIEVKQ
jgi:hypothetical protein